MKTVGRFVHAGIVIVLLAATAWAADPPGRVARLDYMTGQVSVQPHGTDDWVQAEVNRPLTIADNVWADKDSRGELDLGTGFMRINSETSLTLSNVNNDAVQVSLHQGTLNVHVRHLYSGEIWEVDTPNLAFTISKSGEYRFDVDPNADTTLVTVWKGEGQATGQGPAMAIHEGEQMQFSSGDSLTHEAHSAPRPDGFDEWCRVRDQHADQSASAKYVAPGVVGYQDLDEYGTWRETPDYGPVWVPTAVAPGWAPYSDGQWMWEEPWGWTWVDAYPWGFAPFHYGRWVSWGGYWGWAPGPYWVQPWYAPALVAWFGGPGWGVGLGWGWGFGGGFGWCPLGWGEPFYPWYGASRGYFNNVNISNTNITNITNVTNNYFNHGATISPYGRHGVAMPRFASKPGALNAMSRTGLERGLAVRGNSVRVSPNQLRGASALGRVDANPTRQSMLGARAGQPAARPSGAAFSRPTVSRMTPPAGSGRSFGAQAGRSGGTPMARGPENAARGNVGNPTSARTPALQGSRTASPAPAGRYVPRPPQSAASNGGRSVMNNGTTFGRYVPKPPSAGGVSQSRAGNAQVASNHYIPRPGNNGLRSPAQNSGTRFGSANSSGSRSVPRPPAGSTPGRATQGARGVSSSRSMSGAYSPSRNGFGSVPRPTGRVLPAPRDYSSSASRGGETYSSRSYGGYGGYGSYSRGGNSAYGGRGSYSAPSRSYGGYGGYRGNSGSYGGYRGSSGSYGGGGFSSHASSGGHSFGGGGHFGGGGRR